MVFILPALIVTLIIFLIAGIMFLNDDLNKYSLRMLYIGYVIALVCAYCFTGIVYILIKSKP